MEGSFDMAPEQVIPDSQEPIQQPAVTPEVPVDTPEGDQAAPAPVAAKPTYDVKADPEYQALAAQYQQAQALMRVATEDPDISERLHRKLGLEPPRRQPTDEELIQHFRYQAQQNPALAPAAEKAIWDIQQAQQQKQIAQQVQQGLRDAKLEIAMMSHPVVSRYAHVVNNLKQQGMTTEQALYFVGDIVNAIGGAPGATQQPQGDNPYGGGGNPNQQRRPDFSNMPMPEFERNHLPGILDHMFGKK
jgi:hypothetical protein